MYSKPYRHGEYWRIKTGVKSYIEFVSYEEAMEYIMQMFNLTVNGKAVNNQYVILDGCKQTFRSYQTDIATYNTKENKIIVFDDWDISATTIKYFCRWIEQITDCGQMNKARVIKCLKTHCITSNNSDGTLNKFFTIIKG